MNVVVFRTPEERAMGLRMYGRNPIPTDTLFFFPNLEPGHVTTEDLHENIIVGFLDEHWYPYTLFETPPGSRYQFHPQTRHMVEMSALSPARHMDRFVLGEILRGHA